jgi:hypothetical protein
MPGDKPDWDAIWELIGMDGVSPRHRLCICIGRIQERM